MTWGGIGGADHFTDVKIRPRKGPFACDPDLLICCFPATHRALLNTHGVHQFCLPVCPGSSLAKWERKLESHSRTYLRLSHATGSPAGRGGSSSSRCESGASRGPSPQCAPPARSTAHAAASPERRRPGGDCARALCLPGAGGGGGASCVTPGARAGLGWGGAASSTRALSAPAPGRIR